MGRLSLSALVAALLAAAPIGCDPLRSSDRVAVRDSAGVEIVENAVPAEGTLVRWRVDEEPEVEIGAVEGDSLQRLFRVGGATRLRDGRIALTTDLSWVRFYGPDGSFLRSVGGAGEGPGEFRAAAGPFPYRGDSLLVWDARLRRITVLDGAGRPGRPTPLEKSGFNPSLVGAFTDGSLLLRDGVFEAPTEGPRLQTLNLVRYSPEGILTDSLGTFPSFLTAPVNLGGGRSLVSGEILGPRTALAASGEAYYVGTARSYEVEVYGPDGELRRKILLLRGRAPVTGADAEAYREWRLSAAGGDPGARRRVEATLEGVPMADRFPAYDRLHASRDGALWVREFLPPWRQGDRRWLIYDRQGRLGAEVLLPADFRVFEIGEDYVLGVGRDRLDVEYVRLYRLRRGG